MLQFITLFERFLWICSILFTLYMLYYIAFIPYAFHKKNSYKKHLPKCHFAVLIAARNEQAVISHLVDSLLAQNYPKELYDVYVIPNNCTDNTEQVAKAAGANILHCQKPVSTKGEVLNQVINQLLKENKHDAICVFDADNVVDSSFLSAMNNAWCEGAKIAQGFRDSKNPRDTYISSSYSIYYWMINRFYNQARFNAGLSAMINGSGFMVDLSFLCSMGGWNTKSMTEDIEFTTKCILSNNRIAWVPEARTYDEQPLTFSQSWHQRSRWSTGTYQCLHYYLMPLIKGLFSNGFNNMRMRIDQIIFLLAPIFQFSGFISILLGHVLRVIASKNNLFIHTPILTNLIFSIILSFFISCIIALVVIILEKKPPHKMFSGIIGYWFFIMSWIPINAVCLFHGTKEWKSISHTRSVSVNEIK